MSPREMWQAWEGPVWTSWSSSGPCAKSCTWISILKFSFKAGFDLKGFFQPKWVCDSMILFVSIVFMSKLYLYSCFVRVFMFFSPSLSYFFLINLESYFSSAPIISSKISLGFGSATVELSAHSKILYSVSKSFTYRILFCCNVEKLQVNLSVHFGSIHQLISSPDFSLD